MEDPLKLLWKFKNNNNRIQYNTYIFVGEIGLKNKKIFDKIEKLNFYDTLLSLDNNDYEKLSKTYGNKWYFYFFNIHHINNSILQIKESNSMKKELKGKYNEKWYTEHIDNYKISRSKSFYSYESLIKDDNERKNQKKNRAQESLIDKEMNIDYRVNKKDKMMKEKVDQFRVFPLIDKMKGGDNHEEEIIEEQENIYEDDDFNQEYDELEDDEDYQEIENIYKGLGENLDEDSKKTSSLIKEAMEDSKIFNKIQNNLIDFTKIKDNNVYDETLKDVFFKNFVYSQFLFKDDTILTIKKKICCAIKNNEKFGEKSFLIPTRQYFWSEYVFDDNIKKIMIGQKWLRKNELLDVDVEPNNNLRVYEQLSGNLDLLKDNLKRYGSKIRREDDENFILHDYENYMTNNELYMIDLYNELGKNYKASTNTLKDLYDVYIKLYFNKLRYDDFIEVIDYLNNKNNNEKNKIIKSYESYLNDLLIENEIINVVEDVKEKDNYKNLFKENYVTQTTIHLNLRKEIEESNFSLHRIFNEFECNEEFPFIQFQTTESGTIKYYEKELNNLQKISDNIEPIYKWFENLSFGITFKMKIIEGKKIKFMSINLQDTGRIEYKHTWKEEDKATMDDVKLTYVSVKKLIKKLNNENNRIRFLIPNDLEFRYAFINTIQKFELPEEFSINHNHLSDFSRFFYPYISLVIDPRKRLAKVQKEDEKSKFGTYFRFRRVSNYENQGKMEQRIIYFMRNYEYTDGLLASEISKQFNLTEEKASEEIQKIRSKYPNLKKARKLLKKLENIPKYKPPGIGIDIQGRQRDKYKVKIYGVRSKEQLNRIINFINILIYLYSETYLYKKKERQILKEKLKKLTNIAKRRGIVEDLVDYSKEIKDVKKFTQYDKKRLGFKPEKGQSQYTRACQNSGNDKRRRPEGYSINDTNKLIKKGYTYNKKNDTYEKKHSIKTKKGKKEIILSTVKLPKLDEDGNPTDEEVYYSCDPETNGDHMYIGFLTRSSDPSGHCLPCCFIINPATSKNKSKKDFFYECLGKAIGTKSKDDQKVTGDLLYILQDTNKIQEGRIGYLPKYLDMFFNSMLNKSKKIKNHYLSKSESGYYFKFGSKQDDNQYLNAVSVTIDLPVEKIIEKVINVIENDKSDIIFTSLNNGDIKTLFKTRSNYINYLKGNNSIDYEMINNILSIPGTLIKEGINFIVLLKKTILISKSLEKEKVREDFVIDCQDNEISNYLKNTNKKNIILIKDFNSYNSVVLVKKIDEDNKSVIINKLFKYENDKINIINHLSDFYEKNCYGNFIDNVINESKSISAKMTYEVLKKLDKKFNVKYQIIDSRNRCKYIIINDGLIVPVKNSGSLYNVSILNDYEKYVNNLETTIKYLRNIKKISKLNLEPIGVFYENKTNDNFNIHCNYFCHTYDPRKSHTYHIPKPNINEILIYIH